MSIYRAVVTEDLYVIVTIDDVEVDRPGPWSTSEGAHLWASDIIARLENGDIIYPLQHGD